MDNATHTSYFAGDRSYFSLLKKDINKKALQAGFSAKKLGFLDIIVAEMTSNLLKHAEAGELLMCITGEKGNEYLELIYIDNGPGIADPERMLMDGISTSITTGHGLGSIKRLSDFFEIYSMRGWGTIMLCRIFKSTAPVVKIKPKKFVLRSLIVAKPGEIVSGDGNTWKLTGDYLKLLVADGLGHGPGANEAAAAACAAFSLCGENDPVEILRFIDNSIKKTRGVVGTVVVYDFKNKLWNTAGVGNISTRMLSYVNTRNFISYNGIIGHNMPHSMTSQQVSSSEFQQIVLCSDGLKTKWDSHTYPGVNKFDMTVLAAALYKDFAGKTDDMSVVVGKVY